MNWETLKGVVADAMELPAPERSGFLDRACAEDSELRREAEALLSADMPGFLNLDAPPLTPNAPDRVGNYRLESQLGEGGMGVVYTGVRDDGNFEQRVAIKLIKLGMDSGAILRRFVAERRILARLVHPNITRILDGGAASDGRPYFVMELIDGVPIDQYCRDLDVSRTIEIFLPVCDAVAFAHRNLVLHRDIKARNILVDAAATPHLLDFGIAKLLDEEADSEQTATAFRVLTPRAASPEQLAGEPLTTASDVYSLGALLYELLSGKSPYDLHLSTPPRPSQVSPPARQKILAGDLDNIVLKALEKDPLRRYASATDFAADLRRHLDGLPVLARPASFLYRAQKLFRRHKARFAVAALFFLVIVAGIVATLTQARRANRRFAEVRSLAHSVIFELDDAIARVPGATAARAILLSRAITYLDGLAREAGRDRSLLLEVASGYERLGTVQGDRTTAHLLDLDGASRSLALAAEFYRRAPDMRGLASVAGKRSLVEIGRGRVTEGVSLAREELSGYRAIAAQTGAAQDKVNVAAGLRDLGYAQLQSNDLPGALRSYREEEGLRREWLAAHPSDEAAQSAFGAFYRRLAQVEARQRMIREAMQSFAAARAIDEKIVARHPTDPAVKSLLAADLEGPARMAMRTGNFKMAAALLRQSYEIYEEAVAADPTNERPRHSLMLTASMLGQALAKTHDAEGSMKAARRSLDIASDADRSHSSANTRASVADGEISVGDAFLASGKRDDAMVAYRRAEKIYLELQGRNELNIDQKQASLELARKLH